MRKFLEFRRFFALTALSLFLAGSLSGCLGGATNVKTLGTKKVGGTGTAASDSDSFSITVAFRDAVVATNRVVTLQGVRNLASAKLLNLCGTNAGSCTCEFYQGATDTTPATTSAVGISDTNNSVSCTIAGSEAANTFTHVKIKTVDNVKSSGLVQIKTNLTLTDVLGDLDKQKVRKIFRYSCNRTFFEGEGVTPNTITCAFNQKLGLITASYDFYLFASALDGNLADKGGDTAFDTAICGYTAALKISCPTTPTLRYGLYAEQIEPFTVAVTMTSKPEGAAAGVIYGFAALPDSAGNCPTGLVKVRQHVAQPSSLIQGAPTGDCTVNQLSSSFVNNNSLNNTVVEEPSQVTSNFTITRQPNATACDGTGDCTSVTFGGQCTAGTASYTALTPIVCAIPQSLASGAF